MQLSRTRELCGEGEGRAPGPALFSDSIGRKAALRYTCRPHRVLGRESYTGNIETAAFLPI